MKRFLEDILNAFPVVQSVDVSTLDGEMQIDITVDKFNWESLEGLYAKELELLNTFRDQRLNFRVIDGSK